MSLYEQQQKEKFRYDLAVMFGSVVLVGFLGVLAYTIWSLVKHFLGGAL